VQPIPLARPWMGEEEAQSVRETLLTGWITQGPRVKAFEEAFCSYTGGGYACAVSSCTTAIHLALLAVGVRPGDTVITVSYSFIATANAIRHCQAEPFFVDVEPAAGNMDPAALRAVLETGFVKRDGELWLKDPARFAVGESPWVGRSGELGRLGAILVVHQVGMPTDLKAILELASKVGIPVVEDAACAIGSQISMNGGRTWEEVGKPHGDIGCFSFHPRKVISTGDGGMLTTLNPELDAKFRLLRQHGMGVNDLARHASTEVIFENYTVTGFNYRLTDIQAAIGVEQLKKLPRIVMRRREQAARYHELLSGIPGLRRPTEPAWARSNWQSYIVQLDDPGRQRHVMNTLLADGIASRRGVMCAHLEAPYAPAWPKGCLPQSESMRDCGVTLPLFHELSGEDQERVASSLKRALA
jgi:perosamine synthetase